MKRLENSINPKLMEPIRSVRELAAVYTEDVLEVLHNVAMFSQSDTARVTAANSLLDRAHGKPTQSVEIDGSRTKKFTLRDFYDMAGIEDAEYDVLAIEEDTPETVEVPAIGHTPPVAIEMYEDDILS